MDLQRKELRQMKGERFFSNFLKDFIFKFYTQRGAQTYNLRGKKKIFF